MRPFLDRLSELLLQRHPDDPRSIAVVLPGKRAGLHLRRYLALAKGGPLWSPEILDIGAFLQQLAGVEQGTTMELLLQLFDTYRELRGAQAEPLDRFLEWAPTTLRDLSEVDAHLIDLDRFYKDLRAYHELEEWSFGLGDLSPLQERTNQEWRATGDLHRAFTARMEKDRVGTSGFVARKAAGVAGGSDILPWTHIWFAGLNALDPATTRTIELIQAQGRASVAWDADPFYLDDPRQEAGRYLRRSIATLGQGELPPQPGIMNTTRRIRKVSTPNPLAQAVYTAQRLAAMTPDERADTTVVLAQEDLLLPLLQRIPEELGPVNVTMGIPLSMLPVHSLVQHYLDLYAHAGRPDIPVRSLLAVFMHPLLNEEGATHRIIGGMNTIPHTHVERPAVSELIRKSGSLHTPAMLRAFDMLGEPSGIGDGLQALFDLVGVLAPNDPMVQAQLAHSRGVQQRLDRLLGRFGHSQLELRAYRTIRERLLREEKLSIIGEPLRGAQVMGLLETRSLDHARLILVGMNEGTLPRTDPPASWIPLDLRRHHGLPMPADAEAITAYNFQRAMHLATDVEWVLTTAEGKEPGEPSRFIAQWEHEVVGRSHTELVAVGTAASVAVRGMRPIVVPKDAGIMARLHALCQRGLSPSALSTWLRCPLDFYFKYIVGIEQDDPADGRLGSDVLGNAVHRTLQQLLSPSIGQQLTPPFIAEAVRQVHTVLRDELVKELPGASLDHGHYRLRSEMAAKAITDHLLAEEQRCAQVHTRILALEAQVQAVLPNGALLKGRCDRVDLRDGRLTIIDVKTGAVKDSDLRLAEPIRECITPERTYALQLLVYLFAYMKQHPEADAASAAILPLQRPSQVDGEFLSMRGGIVIERSQLPAIELLLTALVDELCDPDTPFAHREQSRYCRVCVGLVS